MTERLPPEPFERRAEVSEIGESGHEVREEVFQDVGIERRQQVHRVSQLVWLLIWIAEALIGLRVLLRLIAANPGNEFAAFVYGFSKPLVGPFQSLTGAPSADGAVLEVGSLIAMLAYLLLGWIVVRLIWLLFERPSARSVSVLRRDPGVKPPGHRQP